MPAGQNRPDETVRDSELRAHIAQAIEALTPKLRDAGEQNPLIDKAIDDTARELTEGRPHEALRSNVSARIAGQDSSPWPLGLSVGGAVAAVVIVVVLMWPVRVEDVDPVPAATVVQDRQDMPVGRALSGSPGEPDRVRPKSRSIAISDTGARLDAKISDSVARLDDKMSRQFVWLVGMLVTVLAAVVGGVLSR